MKKKKKTKGDFNLDNQVIWCKTL